MLSGCLSVRQALRLLLAVSAPLILLAALLAATRAPEASAVAIESFPSPEKAAVSVEWLAPSAKAAIAVEPLAAASDAYIAMGAGETHSCAVMSGGGVQCWGDNTWGQLGDGTTTSRLLPVAVAGLGGSASAVAAGDGFSCAIVNGGVRCWGRNDSGQLGNGGVGLSSTVPVSVSGLISGVSGLSARAQLACAVVSGAAQCWGGNSAPATVPGLAVSVTAIAVGNGFRCALVNGGAECWGLNDRGQLGNGSLSDSSTPAGVSGLASGIFSIAAGNRHACAVQGGTTLLCWGDNRDGQLGANSSALSSTLPLAVAGGGPEVFPSAPTAGDDFSCAVFNSSARCWGRNTYGELGSGTDFEQRAPADVVALGDVSALAAGGDHACAIVAGGGWCWGSNRAGQLGDGTLADRYLPAQVGVVAALVAEGSSHTCAIRNGGVRCWGENADGELGNDLPGMQSVPTNVNGLSSGASSVAAGDRFACAIVSGAVRCWGSNYLGALGNGSAMLTSSVPLTVSGLLSGVRAISAGDNHACALVQSGVQCWGNNSKGQLGSGSAQAAITVPVGVSGLASGASAIAAGGRHTCAVVNGGVMCWGLNEFGQLGNGSLNQSSTPVSVVGLSGRVIALAAGEQHTCALIMDGSVQCWGENYSGELGVDTSQISSTVPVSVSGAVYPAVGLVAGSGHTCEVLNFGAVRCWGENHYGELGDGSFVNRSSPVFVLVLSATNNALGPARGVHTCVVTRSGGVLCWGANDAGQLGDGDTALSPFPVSVNGLCDCVHPSCCNVDLILSCAGPSVSVAARSAFSAMAAGVELFDIRAYFAVRDQVLARTSAGRRYIDMYNANQAAIRAALWTHPALWTEALNLLQQWQPILQALVNGQGGSVVITNAEVQAVKTFLNDLSNDGSPALKQVIAAELARTPLDPFAGQTVDQARASLVGYPQLYLPLIRR